MSIKCNYYENDKVNVRFTFDLFPSTIYKPKHFKSHSYQYSYDDTLSWANKSLNLWNKTGIFLTANVKSLWAGMPDKQRNTIFPKVQLMWTEVNGTTDDSIPSWIDIAAGYMPLIKQYKYKNGVGYCWFYLETEADIGTYFDFVEEETDPTKPITGSSSPETLPIIHLCPHCGGKISML